MKCDEHQTDVRVDKREGWNSDVDILTAFIRKTLLKDIYNLNQIYIYDPRPVKMTLVPIYYLLSDSHPTKKALMDATNDYLIRNEQMKEDRIGKSNF